MGDYEQSREVDALADELFEYLADVRYLPRYFSAITSTEPAEVDAVHVTAVENGHSHDAEAWFRVDRDRRHLDLGSEGANDYHGRLDVTAAGDGSTITVTLHTNVGDDDRINQGLDDTVAEIARLVQGGAAPGAADD